jgi:hypothetical protein
MVPDTDRTDIRSQVIAMVERCPSGALTYAVEGHDGPVEPPLAALVSVVPDGPLFVSGRVPVSRSDGATLEARNRVTLCRCANRRTSRSAMEATSRRDSPAGPSRSLDLGQARASSATMAR